MLRLRRPLSTSAPTGESWDDSALFEGPSIMISFANLGVKMATRARRAIDRLTLKGTNRCGQAGSCVPIPLYGHSSSQVRSDCF
jgi:hypothetical protein